jgi:chromosome segregation ATPase
MAVQTLQKPFNTSIYIAFLNIQAEEIEMAVEVTGSPQAGMDKERLAKLWNAYEMQEKELADIKSNIENYETAISEKDVMVSTLKEALASRDKEIRELEIKNSKLDKETSESKPKLEELQKTLKIEKERFAKLYSLAEELEADLKEARSAIDNRDKWFKENIDVLRTFSRALSERERIIDLGRKSKSSAKK